MLQRFVAAINSINTPILAIGVIILGCVFAVVSKQYGMDENTAAGIVGAGIGLLTGQVFTANKAAPPLAASTSNNIGTTPVESVVPVSSNNIGTL